MCYNFKITNNKTIVQETVMFVIIVGIIGFIGSILFAGWFQSVTISDLSSISNTTYIELEEINGLSSASNFTCVGPFQTFTITQQGLIEMPSMLAYKNTNEFTGGVPSKGLVYYSGSYMFIVSPYPAEPGTFSNSKICVIPSTVSPPTMIVEPAIS